MCFSAHASFTASGVLAVVGAASIKETKTKRGLIYAFIPIFFAIQQFIEGWQWVVGGASAWSQPLAYGFLFFAVIFWPTYVPISVYLIEPDPERKQRLGYFIFLGAIVSAYSLVNIIAQPISVLAQDCCHVAYAFNMPFKMAVGLSYVAATCGSMFFSSHGWIKTMSAIIFISCVASYLFVAFAFVSVWCYFAAIISILVLIHVRSQSMKV